MFGIGGPGAAGVPNVDEVTAEANAGEVTGAPIPPNADKVTSGATSAMTVAAAEDQPGTRTNPEGSWADMEGKQNIIDSN